MKQERLAKVQKAISKDLNCKFISTMFEKCEFTHVVAIDKENQFMFMDVDPELRFKGSESKMWYRNLSELLEDYQTLKKIYY